MGCLKLYEEKNIGTNEIMIRFNKRNDEQFDYDKIADKVADKIADKINKSIANTNENKVENKNFIQKYWSVIATIIGVAGSVILCYVNIKQDITSMQKDINYMTKQIEEMESEINDLHYDMYETGGLIDQIQNGVINLSGNERAAKMCADVTVLNNNISKTTSSIEESAVIGKDDKGEDVRTEKLVNETIFLVYHENEKIVCFLGQFNENYHWEGKCTTNVYNEDGTLYGICVSNFNDGVRLNYKTVRSLGDNKWDYYDRVCKENYNEGVSATYSFIYDDKVNLKSIDEKDIRYSEEFIRSQEKVLEEYYCGNTSNGKFNDDTGNAYFVSFFENSHVKTLYCGNFKDGKFEDFTGKAWYITREEDTDYMYYKGHFRNNSTVNNRGYKFENPVTINRIHEIIGDREFGCEIDWGE